jgi:hypothetical protein
VVYDVLHNLTWQWGWFGAAGAGIDYQTAGQDCSSLGSTWFIPGPNFFETITTNGVIGGCGFELPARASNGSSTVSFWTDASGNLSTSMFQVEDPLTGATAVESEGATAEANGSALVVRCERVGMP